MSHSDPMGRHASPNKATKTRMSELFEAWLLVSLYPMAVALIITLSQTRLQMASQRLAHSSYASYSSHKSFPQKKSFLVRSDGRRRNLRLPAAFSLLFAPLVSFRAHSSHPSHPSHPSYSSHKSFPKKLPGGLPDKRRYGTAFERPISGGLARSGGHPACR